MSSLGAREVGTAGAVVVASGLASLLALAACSSSSARPVLGGSLGAGQATIDGAADGAAPPDGGAPEVGANGGDAAADGARVRDGSSSDEGGETPGDGGVSADGSYMPPPVTPVCSPTATWAPGTVLAISSAADDVLDAITPDELTIVWTEGSGGSATVEIADRAARTDPFSPPQALPAAQFTADRVAISPDGLTLVVVNADARGYSELSRAVRTSSSAFGTASTGSFANLDGALPVGASCGDPLRSADGAAFFYSVYGGSQTATLFRTSRLLEADAWPPGAALAASTGLAAMGALRQRPTGIASDEQTLFVWDEITGTERAAWLDASTGHYDAFVDLGNRSMATTNVTCSHLYYSAPGTGSVDLFVATR